MKTEKETEIAINVTEILDLCHVDGNARFLSYELRSHWR